MNRKTLLAGLPVLGLLLITMGASHVAEPSIAKGPYPMLPTAQSVTICWVSVEETTGGVVHYGEGKTVTESGPKTRYHRVTVTGLKPYTRYNYQVTQESQTSEPASFLTAAKPDQAFHFTAYGDCRTQPDKHAAVIQRMAAFHPDFVVQTGDLVADGTKEDQWDVFWQTVAPLIHNTAYYPALGNHEKQGAPYFRYFGIAREYSFDYGNTHFVALDSNRPAAEFKEQEEFLKNDLKAHQDATWRVVFFHHTPYTCVDKPDRRVQAQALSARLEPILQAGKVQLVINGHDHDYQRHISPAGITYLVTGGGGAPLYSVTPDTPYVKKAKMTHNSCELTVEGKKISVRAVEPDGTEIEHFTLTTP